jgi:hypothetical protein
VAQQALKVASFTVHGTAAQSARWKQAAEAEGFRSVGTWLAAAADAYLKVRAKAGIPVPLAWRKGLLRIKLEDGEMVLVRGYLSPPFGAFYGTPAGVPSYMGAHRYTLVYQPSGRVLATVRTYREAQAIAAELARLWYRGDGSEPAGDPASVIKS